MAKITKRIVKKSKRLMTRARPYQLPVLVLVVAVTALIGIKIIFHSHAANQVSTTTTNNSANRLVFWGTNYTPYYTDADLDKLKSWGVGGISFGDSYFYGMGGTENWTANLSDPTIQTSSTHQLEKQLISSNLIARAHSRGIKVYLDQGVRNYYSTTAPLCNWTDDNCWNTQALPYFANMAGTLKALGADGVWFDTESFGAYSWNLNSIAIPDLAAKGETAIRATVKQRGNQAMSAMLNGFGSSPGYPNLDVAIYGFYWPHSWNVREQVAAGNCGEDCYINTSVEQDFLSGLASAPGYSHIRLTDASLYKSCQVSGCTWDSSNQYNDNSSLAYFSQYFSNWDYAASRISVTPFVWIDNDYSSGVHFSATQSVPYVTDQMQEFRKWGMEGQFGQFNYQDPLYGTPDPTFTALGGWPAYVPAMQAASVLGTVDSTAPSLTVSSPAGGTNTSASNVSFSGSAHDDQAIWYISWSNDRGGSGNFPMSWQTSGGPASYEPWQMNYSGSIPLQSGTNNITVKAVDIHGNTTSQVVTVTSGSGGGGGSNADFNGDSVVNITDLSILAAHYGSTGATHAQGDANGDGVVNIIDLSILAANWNANAAQVTTVNDNTTGTGTNQFNYSGSPGTWVYQSTNCAGAGLTYQGDCHYNSPGSAGAYYQMSFSGTGISVYSIKNTDLGKVDVYVDGVLKQSGIDLYNSTLLGSSSFYSTTGLSSGTHTLKVIVSGRNAGATTDYTLVADRVDISP